jgi:hypothetical protein
MIRVSELLKSTANNLDRVVILDHGNLYPFRCSNKTMPVPAEYTHRVVNSFYIESIYFESKDPDGCAIVKQTMFIELKGGDQKLK